jgi:tRNA (cmo5U34)-methyltransferase
MSLSSTQNNPVHFPADPAKFAFDREVSAVFENMAVRSIPNFVEAHRAHVSMLKEWLNPGAKVLDIGASRGSFFKELHDQYPALWPTLKLEALDNSADMCGYLSQDYPEAHIRCEDVSSTKFLVGRQGTYDVVCVHYVLQFIPRDMQPLVVAKIFNMVRPGGILIWGHKSAHAGTAGAAAHEQYIQFRINNGYTREEIEAKTKALAGSMFPMDHYQLLGLMKGHFSEVVETFRFMMFSTMFAVR